MKKDHLKGFKVPEGYFEQSKKRLYAIALDKEQEVTKPVLRPLLRYVWYSMAVAASVTLVYLAVFRQDENPGFDEIDEQQLVEYINAQPQMYWQHTLELEVLESQVQNLDRTPDLSEEQIQEYLLQQEDLFIETLL